MAKRAPGEGSISRRPDGRWQASLQVAGQRYHLYGRTRAEAAEKLQALQRSAGAGRLTKASPRSVAEFMAEWLEATGPTLRPSTMASYEDLARCHVLPHLGDIRLQQLRPLHLVRLYVLLSRKGLGSRRVQMVGRLLHKALADAVRWQLIPSNPAIDARPPSPKRPEATVWAQDDASAFLAWVQRYEHRYDPLWAFLLGSGCRIGEALGLRWADVDFQGGTVAIRRAVGFVRNRPVEGEPKTAAGARTVSLPAFALESLRVQKGRQAESRLRAGNAWQGGDRCFTTGGGAVPRPCTLRKLFRATGRAAGVAECRIHDLRHVSATLAIRGGADPKSLQRRLGHSSLQMTLGLYAHAVSEGDRQAAEALERALAGDGRV